MKQLKLLFFVFLSFISSLAWATSIDYNNPKDLAQLLLKSVNASRSIPYEGILSFSRETDHNKETIQFNIVRISDKEKIVTMLSPELWKDTVIYKNKNGLWVTPIDEEKRDKMNGEVRHSLWNRLFDDNETLTFHKSEHLLQNYHINKKGKSKIANREAIEIEIKPKHKGRPTVIIFLDKENHKQLKFKWYYPCNNSKETFKYDEIKFGKINDPQIPDISTMHQIYSSSSNRDDKVDLILNFVPMVPKNLPKGFYSVGHSRFNRRDDAVYHTIYSDGIARLSIYQRKLNQEEINRNKEENQAQKNQEPVVKKINRRSREIFFYDKNDLRLSAVGDLHEEVIIKTLLSMKEE